MSSQRDGTEFRFSSLQQEGGWVSFCVPPPRNGPLSVLQKAIRLLALKHNWPSRTRGCARTSAVSLRSPALYITVFSEQPITGCTLKFYASGLDPPHNSLQSEKIKTEGESARSLWDTDAYGDGWTSTVLFLVRSSKEKKKKKEFPPKKNQSELSSLRVKCAGRSSLTPRPPHLPPPPRPLPGKHWGIHFRVDYQRNQKATLRCDPRRQTVCERSERIAAEGPPRDGVSSWYLCSKGLRVQLCVCLYACAQAG